MTIEQPQAETIYTMKLPEIWGMFTREFYHGTITIGEEKFSKLLWGFDVQFYIKDVIFEMEKKSLQVNDEIVISLQNWVRKYGGDEKCKTRFPLIKHLDEIKRIKKLNNDLTRKGLYDKMIETPRKYYAYSNDIYNEIDKREAFIRHILIQIYGDKQFVKSMETPEDV